MNTSTSHLPEKKLEELSKNVSIARAAAEKKS